MSLKKDNSIQYNDDRHELPFLNPKQITQGQTKMLRLVDDLIRNKLFMRSLKRVIRARNKLYKQYDKGGYKEWTKEEQAEHDFINKELGEIIDEYEKLKRRTHKVLHDKQYKVKEKIASVYGLDGYLIELAIARYKKDTYATSNALIQGGDMCRIHSDLDDQISNFNRGDDWIKLHPRKQIEMVAYPISIAIHRNASKRDVLDFIEKSWWIINKPMKESEDKTYRARKRKYDQKMLDFIWQNHSLSSVKLKEKLNKEFPKNDLAYYEMSKLIQLEKQKRLGYFEI